MHAGCVSVRHVRLFTYNGMPAERFLLAVIRSEILCPRTLSYHPQNLYAELLLDFNSMREVLTLD